MDLANASVKGKRFALPRELMSDAVEANVRTSIEQAIRTLEAAGATVDHVDLPSLSLGVSTYYIIAPAEASSNLGRFDGVRYGAREEASGHVESLMATRGKKFGHEVKLRIMVGTYALSAGYYDAYYLRAQQVRGLMVAEIDALWGEYDAILSPTSPCVAFPLGGFSHDPMALKLMDFCTIPANMGGYPALSLPCGLADGLPVGLHLMGPVRGDERLLELAAGVERELGCAPLRPPRA
ncbi:MAG: amidase family protein, partial [Fimbriimonadaceae bacterium]